MTSGLVQQLANARGESCQVLAVFLDVRGFSKFAAVAESSDTALFLRAMYSRSVEKYFPEATFAKPTGDGLLLIRELATVSDEVIKSIQQWIDASLRLVVDFPALTTDDVLITVDVPSELGVGVARGSATRLMAEDGTVIDYSGRCLNLAARLMDLARPQGVVVEDRHAATVLSEGQQGALRAEEVYIRGIAEKTPITVFASADVQFIESALQPVVHQPTFERSQEMTAGEIRSATSWLIRLARDPRADAEIQFHYEYLVFSEDGKKTGSARTGWTPGTLRLEPDGPYARIEFAKITAALERAHVPDDVTVKITPRH